MSVCVCMRVIGVIVDVDGHIINIPWKNIY